MIHLESQRREISLERSCLEFFRQNGFATSPYEILISRILISGFNETQDLNEHGSYHEFER
jgi:hypothetical protein